LHEQPVISRLISHHGVTVNITGATSANARDDGWFDLEIQGKASQIQSALTYWMNWIWKFGPSTPEEEAGKLYNKTKQWATFSPCSPALF